MQSLRIPVDDGVELHVGQTGDGPDVVHLSGGPGCVQYLENDELAPTGFRSWFPEPRGVGRSAGGSHTIEQAVADLDALRRTVGVRSWTVVGHSWGSDLAVAYALQHPDTVDGVVGIAGTGLQRDRSWSAAYHAGKDTEPYVPIDWVPEVHTALLTSFVDWIHEPRLWRRLADSPVPMRFVAAALDIRPSWPLEQLAELVPRGEFTRVPGVPHDFWATHPDVWLRVVTDACAGLPRLP